MQTNNNYEVQNMQLYAYLQNNSTNGEESNDESNESYDFPNLENFLDVMLPKSKKDNLNAHGKRKPLQAFQLDAMYRTPFKVEQFIKLFRIYYDIKFDRRNILSIRNEITNRIITVDLNKDLFGYIKLSQFKDENGHELYCTHEIPMPKYNQDLFKKILTKKLL